MKKIEKIITFLACLLALFIIIMSSIDLIHLWAETKDFNIYIAHSGLEYHKWKTKFVIENLAFITLGILTIVISFLTYFKTKNHILNIARRLLIISLITWVTLNIINTIN